MNIYKCVYWCLAFLLLPNVIVAQKLNNVYFDVGLAEDGADVFHASGDSVNFIADDKTWGGDIQLKYRVNREDWNVLITEFTRRYGINDSTYVYVDSLMDMPLCMKRYYTLKKNGLSLKLEISATGKQEIEIGDIVFPLYWRQSKDNNPASIFEKNFTQRHNIALNSSFITFSKPSGEGPFYLMLAKDSASLEYFDYVDGVYSVYVHSACSGLEKKGNWRLPHTSVILAPKGRKGDKVAYEFLLTAVPRYEDIRDAVYKNGLLDVRSAPGYTLPINLSARLAVRSQKVINKVIPEFPQQTHIELVEKRADGVSLYDIFFSKLGENLVTIDYGDNERTVIEYFVTEPIDTLIKKRSAFIVNKQQHKAPGKWWDGLYSVYDMKYGKLRGPEDTDGFDGWFGYVLACDDPILGKAPFVAAKNTIYPDSAEIASVEYYLKNFVWGKLQRTDKEIPYAYGIYGVPNWYVARDSTLHAMCNHVYKDRIKIWRAYDYPHIIKLYYHMYQIASMYPHWTHYLSAEGYLDRAVNTAFAYFKYPYEILPWFDIYKWGIYNEWIVLELIEELEKRSRQHEADMLRQEWEKKVKYFIYDDKYPYRSEYSFDRTAFESSYAFAKYAVEHPMKADRNLWFDRNLNKWYSHSHVTVEAAREFMKKQHYAGLSVRGWQEPKYYEAGTDCASPEHTHEMSYMSMMGGWSILDYGLLYSNNPDWIELGYNSYLSSWALMNTGDEESGYGYWFPGKDKDGATGQAFMGAKSGYTWLRKFENRGVWHYDGEIDLGYGATFHTARTIVIRDSIFGLHAYGGCIKEANDEIQVIPRDGVLQQFSYVMPDMRYHLKLVKDAFLSEYPLIVSEKGMALHLKLQNKLAVSGADHQSHTSTLEIRTENVVPHSIKIGGKSVEIKKTTVGWKAELPIENTVEDVYILWNK